MSKSTLRPPSPAMGVAAVALFVALGGTGYAASQVTHSSAAAVARKKTKKQACIAARLCPTLKRAVDGEIASFVAAHKTQLQGPAGTPGSQGPQGLKGDQGPQGRPGTNGATNVVVRTITESIGSGGEGFKIVSCNPGERASGGGVSLPFFDSSTTINASYPTVGITPASAGQTPDGWGSAIRNSLASTQTATFYAICAAP